MSTETAGWYFIWVLHQKTISKVLMGSRPLFGQLLSPHSHETTYTRTHDQNMTSVFQFTLSLPQDQNRGWKEKYLYALKRGTLLYVAPYLP